MRGGGVPEAEKVQRYCAFAITNILSSHIDKGIFNELITNGTIADIIVVTLLRINSGITKEALGKAIFNFLTRAEFRPILVGQGNKTDLDLIGAILELGKIELVDLLELSIRIIYNISCEIENPFYAQKIFDLNVPQLLIGRVTLSSKFPGARATGSAKLMCGMAMANISFNEKLARALALDKSFPDASHAIHKLHSEDASYCICTTIFNISLYEECISMADTAAIDVLVETLPKNLIQCTQIAIAALCNCSGYESFHGQLSSTAIKGVMIVMGSPSIAIPIKLDALYFLYNLVTAHSPSRASAIEADCVPALWKLLKAIDDIETSGLIARVVMEICTEALPYIGKLLSDGIMPILLKLSKLEVPTIKYDISRAIYSLTTVSGHETMKILKWDCVDILFWLTLHDCLDLYDPIKKNCVRALRNFTLKKEEALLLITEDRFVTILKALIKSTDMDVLCNTGGTLYNLLSMEECKNILLKRGVIQLIFEVCVIK